MTRRIGMIDIEQTVKRLFIKANNVIRQDVLAAIEKAARLEKKGSVSSEMLGILIENAKIAKANNMPLCQDTGIATVFVEIGRGVDLSGTDITGSINRGVAKAYKEGFLRKSVVSDPLCRVNTGDNTPAIIHYDIVDGDRLSIQVLPKGFGSENKGKVLMLNPTADDEAVIDFCVETVRSSGPDACPPYVVGVGLGGTMESCAFLAKKALLRPIDKHNPSARLARIEKEIMKRANKLGIGVMGLGGNTSVLGVNLEASPTHIAGFPVAVNISCHALRSASAVI
jgi:fumarate hydratase subunit alpha